MQDLTKMIQPRTILNVVDNSGAKKVRCIKVLGGFKKKSARTGDIIVVSVQQLRAKNRQYSKLNKGDVVRALIIKSKNKILKSNGTYTKLDKNHVILINKQGNLIGTRVLGSIPKFLKKKKLLKYFSLCSGTF